MNSERVDAMLADYRRCEGRAAHLANELEMLEHLRDQQETYKVENAVNISPSLSGMPGSPGVSDKVGNLAIRFASGYQPKYITELNEDIERVRSELFEMERVISFVKGWLLVLSDRERFIIEEHVIKGRFWSEIIGEYEEKFGPFSKDGMRKLKIRALEKIYETAS